MDILSPVGEARNTYVYAADGTKLEVVKKYNSNYNSSPVIGSAVNTSNLDVTKTTDYVGNLIFENNVLDRILVDGGYIKNGIYYFYETDHLGDNRTVVNQSGTVTERNDYYPYGMQMAHNELTNSASGSDNKRKYNNKELDVMHGLNLYDSQARSYDPTLERFTSVDPLAEKYYSISPYVYCHDNPINRVDPDGQGDFIIPVTGTAPIPFWPYDPKTGHALLELGNKTVNLVKALAVGTTMYVTERAIELKKTITGEKNYQATSQTNNQTGSTEASSSNNQNGKKENKETNKNKRESSAKLRKKWEKANNEKWPKDPNNENRNQDVSHKEPLADGGTNEVENIEPKPHSEHMEEHQKNGDFKRWGSRRSNQNP